MRKGSPSRGTRIIKYVRRGDSAEDVIEESAVQPSAPDRCVAQSRKDKARDRSYRPPKYAKVTDTRSTMETGEKRQSARLAGGKLAKVSSTIDGNASQDFTKFSSKSTEEAECDSNVADSAARRDPVDDNAPQDSTKAASTTTKGVKCDDSKVANSVTLSDQVNDSVLGPAKVTSSTRTQGESPESPKLGDPIESTPAHQTKAGPIESPQTEEIHREKIPTSLESIRSSPALMRGARTLTDTIL